MFSQNSIKNIFLLMFFLCIFLFNIKTIQAVETLKNDTEGLLIKNKNGSSYLLATSTNAFSLASASSKSEPINLFSNDKLNPAISTDELRVLKRKLVENNSPYTNIDISKVYRQNSDNVSIFVYKDTDGKTIDLAYATKEGDFYSPNPNKSRIESFTDSSYKVLNIIDESYGRNANTTLGQASEFVNAKRDLPIFQQKLSETQQKINETQQKINELLKQKPVDQTKIDQLRTELEKLKSDKVDQENKVNSANSSIEKEQSLISEAKNKESVSCDTLLFFLKPNCYLWGIANITNLIFTISGFFAYLIGILFDFSLELSINSAEFIKKLGVVEIVWSFIRDILNMTFIFILLYTAVKILLGIEVGYSAKKILINVVLFAILMNFSLFAAKFMVDVSNVVSLKIYEAMKVQSDDGQASSISLRIMDTLGVQKIYNVGQLFQISSYEKTGVCANNPTSFIIVSVLGTIILIILCLALGLAAILFIIRMVNIILLFIQSPLWVWSFVIPGNSSMEKIRKDWWGKMSNVLFFPIMYLFQMLIAIIIFAKLSDIQDGSNSFLDLVCKSGNTTSGFSSSISLIVVFILVIIMLMRAIEYGVSSAGSGGGFGSKLATNTANRFSKMQNSMTKSLATKAGAVGAGAAGGLGVGVGAGLAAGLNKEKSGSFWKKGRAGFMRGFTDPTITLKEGVGNVAREQVLRDGKIANALGVNYLLGKVAKKYEDPKNSRGETRTKADERRSSSTVEHSKNIASSTDKKYKILTQEEWEAKMGKKITTDQDVQEFKDYIAKVIKARGEAFIGKGALDKKDMRDSEGRTHFEILMEKAGIKSEDYTNPRTGEVSKKVKFSQRDIQDSTLNIYDYFTKNGIDSSMSVYARNAISNRNRQAAIKTIRAELERQRREASTKDTTKKGIEILESILKREESVKEATKKEILKDRVKKGIKYTGLGDNNKLIKNLNSVIEEINESRINGNRAELDSLEEKANRIIEEHHIETDRKIGEARNKLDELLKKQNDSGKKSDDKKSDDKKPDSKKPDSK